MGLHEHEGPDNGNRARRAYLREETYFTASLSRVSVRCPGPDRRSCPGGAGNGAVRRGGLGIIRSGQPEWPRDRSPP